MVPKSEHRFIRLNLITIIVTLVLILAGGIVRSTGSGMGCPDWPKCFDQYIPPTSVDQLPKDYKEKYVAGRMKKNERFAKLLDKMGRSDVADSIRHDQTITVPETFNVAKTYTEYINRLTGAATGFLLIALVVLSFTYRKKAKRIVILSVVNLIVVGFQGWLGSIVVSTNLLAWIVTLHMLLALVILAILVYTYYYTQTLYKQETVIMSKVIWLKVLILAAIALSVIQITLGTEVREAIDATAKQLLYAQRETWVSKAGQVFSYHRDLAIFVAVVNVFVYQIVMNRFGGKATELRLGNSILIVLLIQIASGLLLSNFALPPVTQVIHLVFSTVLFTLQFYLYLLVYRTNTYNQ
ncbi:cytochrome c oxidase assembly protein subunit 15 [Pedobacter westerhofensis]|uniref:Cytochrome c oxidase assembly protein subunit 15 n=1 Tax=Pedobacter westerhofensis TaxID=425512 RepID=A0A521EI20_9SPHI|nr:COX15/CtaA family protein [Pedobacter westerhofensis]SMO82800.1 cytochrome c oxidase assembly protein subunit 15 [Pedobacter westerhofensis]